MSDASMNPQPAGSRRRWGLWIALLILLLGAAGGIAWWRLHPPVDWEAVYEAHNRAIAVMDQYKYREAIGEFKKVIQLAPDWLPARINLGIALLNAVGQDPAKSPECKAVFEDVLKRHPDNPYAHFCLGILLRHEKDGEEAAKHFEAVLRIDADDAYSWYWLGTLKMPGSPEQSECFRKALKRNPHVTGAIYGMAMNLRDEDDGRAREFLDECEQLKRIDWGETRPIVKYSLMGTYADAIAFPREAPAARYLGPLPLFERRQAFSVQLAPGVRWAKAADFGKDAAGEVRRLVRTRFGATMIALDYNRDGKLDLFLASAVVEKGQVRDLLLRNDGDGRFTEVTAEAGLAGQRPTLGCCAADFDNDGQTDLLLTGIGVQKLFRNTGDGKFRDVTAEAKLDQLTSVCLTAMCIDIDMDCDLDILFCEFAPTGEDAVKLLKGEKAQPGGVVVYLHEGEAPGVLSLDKKEPPLDCKFKRTNLPSLQGQPAPLVGMAASDMDGDRDLDLLILADKAAPAVVANDRLLRFQRIPLSEDVFAPGHWNGALVLDVGHRRRSDFLLLSTDQSPRLLINRQRLVAPQRPDWFELFPTNSPPLRQAVAVDLNLDSWTDVVGLSRDGIPVLLHNQGGQLVRQPEAFGRDEDWPRDLIALIVCDADGDTNPDLFVWSEDQGLKLYENRGNGGKGVQVEFQGRNAVDVFYHMRSNADGIGTWAVAQVRDLWAGQENTTLCAGLGQSRQPLVLGLAQYPRVEVLLLRWPDGTLQAEPDVLSGEELLAGQLHRISQRNRLEGSCPILFAWDGRRFAFVNDFLGAGSIGETGPDGTCRPPRSEESLAIGAEQLVPRDGQYVLKITEPMDETTYLDYLQLAAVDHPPDVRVYPEERFVTGGPAPSQQLVAFRKEVFPITARDQRGRDVTEALRRWDRVAVDDFAKRAWIGFAEEHGIELNFGDRLASFGPNERLYLCLAGWTEYPFPESIWAAHQAGVHEQWPILERQDESGQWRSLGESGFPAGMPRMMLVNVTGKLTGPRCRLRLRTNMHVCWDQAFVAKPLPDGRGSARTMDLEVHKATLAPGRIPAEYSPDGCLPKLYDYHRSVDVPLVGQSGRMTRFGEVTELLQGRDDRFVIFGPGDDLTVRFDAASLPPLPAGWKRSFVLRTAGYCKDTALSTAHGATVEPLPFAAMRNYPYGPDQHYPSDAAHRDYQRRYLTREVQANPWPRRE